MMYIICTLKQRMMKMNKPENFKGCYNFGDSKLAQLHIDNKTTEDIVINTVNFYGHPITRKATTSTYHTFFTYAVRYASYLNGITFSLKTAYIGQVTPHR